MIDSSVMKSAILNVIGPEQLAKTNGFAVFNGLIMISGGKYETR